MSRADYEAQLARLSNCLKQVDDALLQISLTNSYVIRLLMQEKQELKYNILNAKELLEKK